MAEPPRPTPAVVELTPRGARGNGGLRAAASHAPDARRWARHLAFPVVIAIVVGLVILAISQLNLHSVGHTLASARVGWVLAALALMGSSLVLRAASWHQTLEAAIPDFSGRLPRRRCARR